MGTKFAVQRITPIQRTIEVGVVDENPSSATAPNKLKNRS
jgi:hypothetical protein